MLNPGQSLLSFLLQLCALASTFHCITLVLTGTFDLHTQTAPGSQPPTCKAACIPLFMQFLHFLHHIDLPSHHLSLHERFCSHRQSTPDALQTCIHACVRTINIISYVISAQVEETTPELHVQQCAAGYHTQCQGCITKQSKSARRHRL